MPYNQKYNPVKTAYDNEHCVRIGLKLMKTTDADILEVLDHADSKQGEIKRLLRIAMSLEAEQGKARRNNAILLQSEQSITK